MLNPKTSPLLHVSSMHGQKGVLVSALVSSFSTVFWNSTGCKQLLSEDTACLQAQTSLDHDLLAVTAADSLLDLALPVHSPQLGNGLADVPVQVSLGGLLGVCTHTPTMDNIRYDHRPGNAIFSNNNSIVKLTSSGLYFQ